MKLKTKYHEVTAFFVDLIVQARSRGVDVICTKFGSDLRGRLRLHLLLHLSLSYSLLASYRPNAPLNACLCIMWMGLVMRWKDVPTACDLECFLQFFRSFATIG